MGKYKMINKKYFKPTKELLRELENQPTKCECGYPYSLKGYTVYEGFWFYGRVYEEYTEDCKWCGKSNTWKA